MAEEWLTYQQAGERFGISAEAVRRHARRHGWRTQRANDGRALVLTPEPEGAKGRARPGGHLPGRLTGQPGKRPPGQMPGDAGELVGELRRRAEAAEARADILAGEVVQQRERAAKAEGQAMTLRHGLENALGRAERAEARAEAEARTAIETRRQVTEAMMQVASLQTERDTALASRDAAQAAADAARAAEAELAGMTATTRQVPGMTLRDVAIGVGGGAVVAFLTWAVLR